MARLLKLVEYTSAVALALAVIIIIGYQVQFVLSAPANAPFLEPDNYMYYICAQQGLAHSAVSNPYVLTVNATNCFENPGLHTVPMFFNNVLHIPLIWAFRIPYLLAIIAIYVFSLLLARQILENSPLNKSWKRLVYSMVLLSFPLMQQTQIIEWRGSAFIVAFQLIILYLLSYAFTADISRLKRWGLIFLSWLVAYPISYYMWSGWYAALAAWIVLCIAFMAYRYIPEHRKTQIFKWVAVGLIAFAFVLFVFNEQAAIFISNIFSATPLVNFGVACTNNVLQLSEQQCLTFNTGLGSVLISLVFASVAVFLFMFNKVFGLMRKKYEIYFVGMLILLIMWLCFAVAYLRLLQFIAPELSVFGALGIIGLFTYFNKLGSSRLIVALVMSAILLSNAYGVLLYASDTLTLYHYDNLPGLIGVAAFLNQTTQNSSVYAYYGYGDYLEAFGHVKAYSDTIVQLYQARAQTLVFNTNDIGYVCSSLDNLTPQPDYVLLTPYMLNITIFQYANKSSLARTPNLITQCGYSLYYENQSFYLYQKNSEGFYSYQHSRLG